MAKLRKQKPGEHRDHTFLDSDRIPCAVVRHQKLCLKIDVDAQRIHGYTELKVLEPTSGVVGLHAQGLNIERVLYEGTPAEHEVLPAFEGDSSDGGSTISSTQKVPVSAFDAADSAYSEYMGVLEKELAPELLVFVPESVPESTIPFQQNHDVQHPVSEVVGSNKTGMDEKNGPESGMEVMKDAVVVQPEEKEKLVRVDYWLEKPAAGAHFLGHIFHTSNQLQRARCWFPCVDLDCERCSYEMEFTVNADYVAVSCGKLLYQVISKEGTHLKTYVYSLDVPVAAQFISLVVAPLEVQPDRQNASISHFCTLGSLSQLQCTVSLFHTVFSFYEDYLGASFPFGSYNHVFVDSELTMSSASVGAAMAIFSSHLLVDERVIDQTINTRIKLAHALARQWFGVYIFPDSQNDAWLVEGLSMFLTDLFIKRSFGNNEICYRRFKANEAVCKVDIEGAPPLCPSVNLYGTERIGMLGHIQSWKAVAVVQMLEKQMGPEPFRKILQRIILRAQDPARNSRTLSTKEFRHFANKLGNLERPFLKDFFPHWVDSPGCPILRMGFLYSKRRNMIELAVHRGCTSYSDKRMQAEGDATSGLPKMDDVGWPGMMSIRVHELDGMYDHPSLPMSGDTYQLLEIHCHSKLAGRRIQRPRKGSKLEVAEDMEQTPATDARQNIESPLLWLRADPQMEYLADIQLRQPEQMWINQLEKDKDVVAQLQAIAALSALPQMSFAAVNALNNCLTDSKIFYRVRIEAAFALASTATEATGWAGLSHLTKLYKSRRYDPDMGLPRPNDFHDLAEYFVLEVIPGAVAIVRGSDGRSPPEAVEFILQLLKYNDNSGNQFSDVYWICSIIKSIGKLEFGQQSLQTLLRILKRIDRFLQYDRLMPSYNNLVTLSCIHTLTELALKFSHLLPQDRFQQIVQPFKDTKTMHWKVRVEALQALVELEIHFKGLDEGIQLALELTNTDPSVRVQSKLLAHTLHISILKGHLKDSVQSFTLSRLLRLLQSRKAFYNTIVRHYAFCILQVLAGRPATLFRRERSDTKVSVVRDMAVQPMENINIQEPKGKTGSFKLRLQPPQDLPVEPVRIRLVTTGSHASREAVPTVSGTSSGKQESDRKVGVVKLRLKPTSSTQDTTLENLKEKGPGSGPVQSSSMSVELGVKTEQFAVESPHSIKPGSLGNVFVKEESDGINKIDVQKDPSSSNDMSIDKTGDSRACQKSSKYCTDSVIDSIHKERSKSLDVLVSRITSDVGISSSDQELQVHVAESHGEHHLGETLQEDMGTDARIKLVEDSNLETGTADEEYRQRQKKRKEEERRERKRKRDKERDDHKHDGDHHEKRRDKHNDPVYLEKKRLKKEKRREEQQRLLQDVVGNEPSETATADVNFLKARTATGTSDTVVRLKFKRL